MYIPVTPLPKPRMTQRDKWAQRPVVVAYRAYKDDLRQELYEQNFNTTLLTNRPLWLAFVLPLPKSYPIKKKLAYEGAFHKQKPDIDNLVKGFLDALLEDDSVVYEVHALKVWGTNPGIYYGEEEYNAISKAHQKSETRPDAVQEPSQAPDPTVRGVARHRGLRMRGVSPRTRTR